MTTKAEPRGLVTATPIEKLKDLITQSQKTINAVAPKHLNAERMARIVAVECQRNPALLECAPVTIVGAALQAAVLGFEIGDGTGRAYLVPLKNNQKGRMEANLWIGYPGYISLMWNTGLVSAVFGAVVHKKDRFHYEYGLNQDLKHTPSGEADPGPVTHAYFGVRFNSGGTQFVVMTIHELETARRRSRMGEAGAWKTDREAMYLKTAVRRGRKLIPASTEKAAAMLKGMDLDAMHDAGRPQDLGMLIDPDEKPTPVEPMETTAEQTQDTGPSAAQQAREKLAKKAPIDAKVVEPGPDPEPVDMPGDAQDPFDPLDEEPSAPPPAKAAAKPAPVPAVKKEARPPRSF